jgi:hypothetical protein
VLEFFCFSIIVYRIYLSIVMWYVRNKFFHIDSPLLMQKKAGRSPLSAMDFYLITSVAGVYFIPCASATP